ncbi:Hsp20 family protein [Cytobacillus spongiae]|uniref:Hsp20/alpha crystallin family protein n=1 Tax=Cytobacillus spongiae TaxID=2901381 RepID=UPI001F25A9F8|nr:Hsp20 family protein [Cytobacillus spongiae]UII54116.1 Hsp20 family protein [Cytobacillus spongiae]
MEKDHHVFDLEEMENWLKKLYLDPFTSYLDECQFRVDLFETAEEYILEALLPHKNRENIEVHVNGCTIEIKVSLTEQLGTDPLSRTIEFPCDVKNQHIRAQYDNNILEIYISKSTESNGENRSIFVK